MTLLRIKEEFWALRGWWPLLWRQRRVLGWRCWIWEIRVWLWFWLDLNVNSSTEPLRFQRLSVCWGLGGVVMASMLFLYSNTVSASSTFLRNVWDLSPSGIFVHIFLPRVWWPLYLYWTWVWVEWLNCLPDLHLSNLSTKWDNFTQIINLKCAIRAASLLQTSSELHQWQLKPFVAQCHRWRVVFLKNN